MLTRRLLLSTAAALAGLLLSAPVQELRADPVDSGQAVAFVQQTGSALIAAIEGAAPLAEKQAHLQGIIDRTVDVDGVGRFCLGRFWRTATPEQQRTYLDLFHRVLMRNITSRVGEYQGVRFQVGRAESRDDATQVSTVVTRPNNPPATVIWVVANIGGSPRIIDVLAEGTSLRLTQRSDYASYLARNGNNVDALIAALRQQATG